MALEHRGRWVLFGLLSGLVLLQVPTLGRLWGC